MDRTIHATARNFGRVFQRQMVWCDSLDQLLATSAGRV
jgi:lipoyl(octanoyl) transferase